MSTNPERDLSPQVVNSLLNAQMTVLTAAASGALSEDKITEHTRNQNHEAYDEMSRADEALSL